MQDTDRVNVCNEVVEVFEVGVREHEMNSGSCTLQTGTIQQRGDEFSIWIVGMQRVDGVGAMFDDILKGISGGCGMSWPGTNSSAGYSSAGSLGYDGVSGKR